MAASLGLAGLAGCRRPEHEGYFRTRSLPRRWSRGCRTSTPRPCLAAVRPSRFWSRATRDGRPRSKATPDSPTAGAPPTRSPRPRSWSCTTRIAPARCSSRVSRPPGRTMTPLPPSTTPRFASGKGRGCESSAKTWLSPSLDLLREHFRAVLPEAGWHVFDPVSRANIHDGAALAFGSPVIPRYQFDQAEIILSLDSDFLGLEEDGTRHHRGFSRGRLGEGKTPTMNRLYVVESQFSITGGMADHRLRLPSSQVLDYTMVLARELLTGEQVCPCAGKSSGSVTPGTRDVQAVREARRTVGSRGGRGLTGSRRQGDHHRGPPPASHRPRLGLCAQCHAGQHGQDDRASQAPGPTSGGDAPGACPGNRQGRGGDPDHPGRQPGLHRSGRPGPGRSDQEGRHHDPPGTARRRDVPAGVPGISPRLITWSRGETPAPGMEPCCPSSR